MSNIGKVSEFISICLQLTLESSKIISQIQKSGSLGEQWKGKNDPMTIADLKSQALIIKGIRQFFPQIKIVAEEQIDYTGDLNYDFQKLNKKLIPEQYFLKNNLNNQLNISDAVVYIDPLDGTLSYVNGELDSVCTLIGVTINGLPTIGIVGQHYDDNNQYNPKIYFAHSQVNQVFYAYGSELNEEGRQFYLPYEFQKPIYNSNLDNLVATISQNRISQQQLDTIQALKPVQIIRKGGFGKKGLMVLEKQADYLVYLSKGASRWDICALEAIISAAGGFITDINANNYQYDENMEDFHNQNGGLMSMKKEVLDYISGQLSDYKI
ncbi:hypothetical protein IMG5_151750 [Ichthyophthirius multifiliis]|uniref:3'(2'),5'-bisphosphate nucleotidase n=1 Tax=Ichthyophthirius multifiliis TaxID=5932 RepID=G0QYR7_ICHMU|nr:hypothetical protein IMG5_151750 [Ichthyophthirius multifiliis]EGR29628.1 hypothetical protein IMG5_151750 [Ichthyophthirius multifiliis]|eukprot:XP_004030864.1 hypothetical protein IMG5_151750 [Ichthyophthirius multifiliis]